MESHIIFREYQKQDAPFLADIIRTTWNYDRFCSPKTAGRLARLYLASCLAEQTYTQVACINHQPVGIIMATDHSRHKRPWFGGRLMDVLSLYLSKEGRGVIKAFSGIHEIDETLLANQKIAYEGEVVFFAIAEQSRGSGIGRSLFTKALDYLKARDISRYYLYTDSSCNYGFYEHQGMVRCQAITRQIPIQIANKMEFYLYEGMLSA